MLHLCRRAMLLWHPHSTHATRSASHRRAPGSCARSARRAGAPDSRNSSTGGRPGGRAEPDPPELRAGEDDRACAARRATRPRRRSSTARHCDPSASARGAARRPERHWPLTLQQSVAKSDTAGRAQVAYHAVLAARRTREAHPPPVPDEEMREPPPVGARDEPLEVPLDLDGIVLAREAKPLREPAHVRVDDDPLRLSELRGDDVRRLPRNARQADELLEPSRHLALELLDEHPHRPLQRLRLLAEEPGRADVALELGGRDGEVVLRPTVLAEEARRNAVDVHVGR